MIRQYDQPPLPPRVWDEIVGKMVIGHKMHEFAIAFRCILMQPVYAKDQNGVEIYELDTDGESIIVYSTRFTGYMVWFPEPDDIGLESIIPDEFEIKDHIFEKKHSDLYDAVKGELGI